MHVVCVLTIHVLIGHPPLTGFPCEAAPDVFCVQTGRTSSCRYEVCFSQAEEIRSLGDKSDLLLGQRMKLVYCALFALH